MVQNLPQSIFSPACDYVSIQSLPILAEIYVCSKYVIRPPYTIYFSLMRAQTLPTLNVWFLQPINSNKYSIESWVYIWPDLKKLKSIQTCQPNVGQFESNLREGTIALKTCCFNDCTTQCRWKFGQLFLCIQLWGLILDGTIEGVTLWMSQLWQVWINKQ